MPRKFQATWFLVSDTVYAFSGGPWQALLTSSRVAVPQLPGSILTESEDSEEAWGSAYGPVLLTEGWLGLDSWVPSD